MKIHRLLTLLLTFHISLTGILAQISLPEITPPDPAAREFMKYGEIPVNYSTGVPQIEIPLYTVKGKKLELPISISYHASGVKVTDIASSVGLGWVLNCGGIVTRSILGKRDEDPGASDRMFENSQEIITALSNSLPDDLALFEDLLRLWVNDRDPQSDRYYYSLPNGTSGIFRYDYLTDDLIMLPFRPFKIEKEAINQLSGFKITDEYGTIYTFDAYNLGTQGVTSSSEFYLTRMESADGTDFIEITYEESLNQTGYTYSKVFMGPVETANPNCIYASFCEHYNVSASFQNIAPKITKITSSLATVNFNYEYDRPDFPASPRLDKIEIVSNIENSVVKTIQFYPKPLGSVNPRLGLEQVDICSSIDCSESEEYSFQYEEGLGNLPPYETSTGPYNEDYWGYDNNSNSPSLVPEDFVPDEYKQPGCDDKYGNRDPLEEGAKKYIIKEIKYPTGGRTVFTFDRNYSDVAYENIKEDPGGFVGGLRVSSVTHYNEDDEIVGIKTYKYFEPKARKFEDWNFNYIRYRYTGELNCQAPVTFVLATNFVAQSSPFVPQEAASGLPIVYLKVIEYNGTETNNAGKTEYNYSPPFSANNIYDNPQHPAALENPRFIHPYHYDKGNYSPKLLSKIEYAKDGQSYDMIAKTIYTYSKLFSTEYYTGIHLVRTIDYSELDIDDLVAFPSYEYSESIKTSDTKAYEEAELLTNTVVYTYDINDPTKYVTSTTDLEYDPEYLQVRKKTVSTSKEGISKITEYKYPFDYTSAPYQDMEALNIITPVIEQTEKINASTLQTTKTNYVSWDGDKIIAPNTVETTVEGVNEIRARYKYDDITGNLTEYSKEGGMKTSILWGYNQSLPIARIANASLYTQAVVPNYNRGIFNLSQALVNGETRDLNGEYHVPEVYYLKVKRTYYKGTDHAALYTITIYDSQGCVVRRFADAMEKSKLNMAVTDELVLEADDYTADVNVIYYTCDGSSGSECPSGATYTDDIYVDCFKDQDPVNITIPTYTSFEEGIPSGWEPTACILSDYSGTNTGRKVVGSGVLKSPPMKAGTYRVSFWAKGSSAYPTQQIYVNGTPRGNPDDVSGQRYTLEITIPTDYQQISFGLQYIIIDEIRICPVDALMTTYTYDPLVGVTSVTDARYITTYYVYDEFGRLEFVKDHNGDILQKYDYHYAP